VYTDSVHYVDKRSNYQETGVKQKLVTAARIYYFALAILGAVKLTLRLHVAYAQT
jgi:hypothetical protein